jgi:transcriptional regulator with XRE-family HTH domain
MIFGMPPRRQPAPTLRLRRLAAELRRLRSAAGLTREEVTDRTSINNVTLYRIEQVQAKPQRRTLMALLELYGVPEDARPALLDLLRQAAEPSWLQTFPDLPEVFSTFFLFESEATTLLNYETLFIPGLLQTEDYARAVYRGGSPTATNEEIQRLVEARMSRQAVLTRESPLRLWTIIDEAALHRPVGGHKIMAAQLDHLAESAAELPHVTLQVIPYEAGAHPGMAGAFAVLQFGGDPPTGDVVYVESPSGSLFLEDETDVIRFARNFEHLRAAALAPQPSIASLRRIARDLRGGEEA